MELKIGLAESGREIEIDLGDEGDAETVRAQVERVMTDDKAIAWFTDRKGRQYGVKVSEVAYVEISDASGQSVGFGR